MQLNMESRFYYIELYDLYGELLTEKQQNYFEDYYFQNLTLSELGENYEVSRNAIHKQLKEVVEKLESYEKILKLYQKKNKLNQLLEQVPKKLQEQIKKEFE